MYDAKKPAKTTPMTPIGKKQKSAVLGQMAALKNMIKTKKPAPKAAAPKTKLQNPSFIGGNKQYYGPPFGYKNK